MAVLRDLIANDVVYYCFVFLVVMIFVNVLSRFLENLILLLKNFRLIGFYLRKFILLFFRLLIKIVFFPITFWKWWKEYCKYNHLVINNSRFRDVEGDK